MPVSPAPVASEADARPRGGSDLLLVVRLGDARYALPLSAVSEVSECGPLRPVPRAPEGVLGLTERHGRVVTVLDLARLVGRPAAPGATCLVRLASPLDHLALAVPSSPRHVTLADGSTPEEAEVREPPPVLLDPERLLVAAESGIPGAPRSR